MASHDSRTDLYGVVALDVLIVISVPHASLAVGVRQVSARNLFSAERLAANSCAITPNSGVTS